MARTKGLSHGNIGPQFKVQSNSKAFIKNMKWSRKYLYIIWTSMTSSPWPGSSLFNLNLCKTFWEMQLGCCKAKLLSFKILVALAQNFNSTLFMQMPKWFKLKVPLCISFFLGWMKTKHVFAFSVAYSLYMKIRMNENKIEAQLIFT